MDRFIATFSGIRWVHSEQFMARILCYVRAFAQALPEFTKNCPTAHSPKLVYVGWDGRDTGATYSQFIIAALLMEGFDIAYIDVVPTPTIQQMVRNSRSAGGIIATASHNPPKWNGLKFVGPSSIFLTPDECANVYGRVTEDMLKKEFGNITTASPYYKLAEKISDAIQEHKDFAHSSAKLKYMGTSIAVEAHIRHVLAQNTLINADMIREAHFAIGFSGCNASGTTYIRSLCEHLGVELKIPYLMDLGALPLTPEPIPENLMEFSNAIRKHAESAGTGGPGCVHISFAVDPDADRLVVLDENGIPLGEDYTLAVCVDYALSLQQPGEYHIVTNVSTSLVVAEACRKHEAKGVKGILHYTAVGEVNVALKMLELGNRCLIGGEGNGGVMLPCAHIGRDSIVAIVLVLSWLAGRRKQEGDRPLSELIAHRFNKCYIKKAKYDLKEGARSELEAKLQELAKNPSGYEVSTVDGVKFMSAERQEWVHIRFSNTEPILRIIAESLSEEASAQLIEKYQRHLGLSN